MDTGQTPVGIFIDLSKAFDTLDTTILIQKLNHYGLADSSFTLLQNYLTNRKQYMQFSEIDSELMTIRTGVPQGSILDPLLFLIYVTDVANVSNLFHFILFADDTSLESKTETLSASENKNELDKLCL